MQEHSLKRDAQTALGNFLIFFKVTVLVVAHQRVTGVLRMNTDLVCAAGLQIHCKVGDRSETFNELKNAVARKPLLCIHTNAAFAIGTHKFI